jgi:hypothetical protein
VTLAELGVVTNTALSNQSLAGAGPIDAYWFRNARARVYVVSAAGTRLRLVDPSGNVLASGVNQVAVRIDRPRATVFVQTVSATGWPVSGFTLSVNQTSVLAWRSGRPLTANHEVAPPAPDFGLWSRLMTGATTGRGV